MTLIRSLGLVAASVAALPIVAHGALPAPPPAEAFAALPAVSDVALSQDGRLLAWGERDGTREQVVVFDLASHAVKRRFAIDAATKLRDINWSDNETVLIDLSASWEKKFIGEQRYEVFRTLAADVTSGQSKVLLMTSGAKVLVTSAQLVEWYTTKPKKVVMSSEDYSPVAALGATDTRLGGHRQDSGWIATLFEVDTRTGTGERIEQGTPYTYRWIVNPAGECVARADWNPQTSVLRILAKRGMGWSEIYSRKDERLQLFGLTADGAAIVAIAANDRGRSVLWAIPIDGSGAKVLLEDPERDVLSVVEDRFTDVPVGVWLSGPKEEVRWIDKSAQARYESVARAFKGRSVVVYGRSQDGRRVLAYVDGPSDPGIYYLVDFSTGRADIAGEEYPALADVPLGEVRSITYKARDGTEIPAYLTIPPGAEPRSLPLVVLPHGGLEQRDSDEFDWWSQFIATRGYAVLRPQFRGSWGFGEAFRLAGRHQWGLLMQDDVTDGVKAMIEQGIADAHRVCIVGAGYGGYSALAGAAFTPDLYKCAVSVGGVSDLPAMLGTVAKRSGEESSALATWRETVGSPFDKNVIERSPARAADQIRVPILLLHGVNDSVVPIEQSEQMARALQEAGKKVTFVKLAGEDHWMSRADTRLQVLQEIEKFLKENL